MFDTLYCHIGAHKTATTSIQKSLMASKDALARHNFWFVPDRGGVLAHFADNPMRVYPDMVRRRGLAYMDGWGQRAVDVMTVASERGGAAIFSTEEALFLRSEEIGRMAAFFGRISRKVVVLYYVRHPLSRLPSMLTEMVKSAGATIDTPLERSLEDYEQVLSPWIAAFGRQAVQVRPFHPSLWPKGGPVAEFCGAIGDDSLFAELTVVRTNEGLSQGALLIKSAMNARGGDLSHNKPLLDLLASIGGPKASVPRERLEALAPLIERNLAYLRETFGVELPEPELQDHVVDRNVIFDDKTLADIGAALKAALDEQADLREKLRRARQRNRKLRDQAAG
ncbi:hypothetical protein [Algicella marina]|uniref:Uncharacterized protein n=1 Tax=Algicella marina TaxID=2683284 RepID=A0A6P1T376_9RHOB|nr:hypothetical protein [Algicella marina]QHQ36211.1 hypothetical protein GO499_14055 [Algicella marina]